MKIALIDQSTSTPWIENIHRFEPLRIPILSSGNEPIFIDAARISATHILTGLAREGNARPLIDACRVTEAVRFCQPDLCLAPHRNGLAHGLLMARACGEIDPKMRVLLLDGMSSRASALVEDLNENYLAPVVADAMERFCLAHADALIAQCAEPIDPDCPIGRIIWAPELSLLDRDVIFGGGNQKITRLVYVGVFDRRVVPFIDAVERLADEGHLARRSVLFAGPIGDDAGCPGRTWLGRRAQRWSFDFSVQDTRSFCEATNFAMEHGSLGFATRIPRALIQHSGLRRPILPRGLSGPEPASSFVIEAALLRELQDRSLMASDGDKGSWREALKEIFQIAPRATPRVAPVGLSVCILHRDRPELLEVAVRSVLDQVADIDCEIVILDNGSCAVGTKETLAALDAHASCRVVYLQTAVPVAEAMNKMARSSTKSILVFLDDDNVLAHGGLARLAKACAVGAFDVITSNLEIFDGDVVASGCTIATLAFIGPARTAGLFFNGFGDTAMAIRRAAFERLGGFLELGAPYPALDWILLARAQAAGLTIGTLQEPAFRYRRDLRRAEASWQKHDQHGIRRLLLQHAGDAYDPVLLAKLSQSVMLDFA